MKYFCRYTQVSYWKQLTSRKLGMCRLFQNNTIKQIKDGGGIIKQIEVVLHYKPGCIAKNLTLQLAMKL